MITYATGRDWKSSYDIMSEVELSLPVAVCNGGVIIDFSSEKLLKGYYIHLSKSEKITEIAEKNGLLPNITVYQDNTVKTCYVAVNKRNNKGYYLNILRSKPTSIFDVSCTQDIITENVISIAFVDSKEKILAFCSNLDDTHKQGLNINIFEDPFDKTVLIVDITSGQSSKGIATNYIAGTCGISENAIVAFGNDTNDVELLRVSSIGIAVGNAPHCLKKFASGVLEYNEGKSVLDFIEEHYYKTK